MCGIVAHNMEVTFSDEQMKGEHAYSAPVADHPLVGASGGCLTPCPLSHHIIIADDAIHPFNVIVLNIFGNPTEQ